MSRGNSRIEPTYQASIQNMTPFVISLFLGLIEAEILLNLVGIIAGGIAYAIVLLALVNAYAFSGSVPHRRVFLVLILVPLLRIFSLVMPLPQVPQIYWYAMIGAPLLLSIWLIHRGAALPFGRLRLSWRGLPLELMMGLTGIPVGVSAFLILRPKPLGQGSLIIDALILTIFSGFLEELIFRGLLAEAVEPILRRLSGFLCSVLFMSLYIGSQSALYVILAGIVGLMYAVWADRTRTIWGVAISHSLWVIGLVVIWPVLLR